MVCHQKIGVIKINRKVDLIASMVSYKTYQLKCTTNYNIKQDSKIKDKEN
jgi:hypothetical protein